MASLITADLARFGPGQDYPPVRLHWARQYCRRLVFAQYENFTVASLLLPRRLIPHFHSIYAFCRWADDLADETGGGRVALGLLRWWRDELSAMYAGSPRHPVMVALAPTVRIFEIPPKPFHDLLFAFEQDQLVKRYTTYEQLLNYCRYSANPVGHLVLYLGRAFTPENSALSDLICTALQLTNFWQDVARDFDERGRVYLPEVDRHYFGYSDVDLAERRYTPAFAELMRYEVERARDLFYRGMPLVERLPDEMRSDVELFIEAGLAVLRRIERQRYNVWKSRPKLSGWDKGMLLAGVGFSRLREWLRERG